MTCRVHTIPVGSRAVTSAVTVEPESWPKYVLLVEMLWVPPKLVTEVDSEILWGILKLEESDLLELKGFANENKRLYKSHVMNRELERVENN